MSESFDTLKKSFDNVSCFVKLFVKAVKFDGIGFVGNTGSGVFLRISSEQKALSAKTVLSARVI